LPFCRSCVERGFIGVEDKVCLRVVSCFIFSFWIRAFYAMFA